MTERDEITQAIEKAEAEVKAKYKRITRQREAWRKQTRRVWLVLLVFAILFVVAVYYGPVN